MRNVSNKIVAKIKRPILFSLTIFPPRKLCHWWYNVEK